MGKVTKWAASVVAVAFAGAMAYGNDLVTFPGPWPSAGRVAFRMVTLDVPVVVLSLALIGGLALASHHYLFSKGGTDDATSGGAGEAGPTA